jgi:hypothetical protein
MRQSNFVNVFYNNKNNNNNSSSSSSNSNSNSSNNNNSNNNNNNNALLKFNFFFYLHAEVTAKWPVTRRPQVQRDTKRRSQEVAVKLTQAKKIMHSYNEYIVRILNP